MNKKPKIKNSLLDFDLFYSNKSSYFGRNSSDGLVSAIKKYSIKSGRALDIGAGEGRNSLFLANLGFEVDAIEPTKDGCRKIRNQAKKLNLKLNIKETDYLSVKTDDRYDFILAATSLDHMDADYLQKAIVKIKTSLNKGGLVYIVVFTEDDPGNLIKKDGASECSSFIKHYFKKNELKNYFSDFKILFYSEYQKKDETHGKLHWHAKAKIIAEKKF